MNRKRKRRSYRSCSAFSILVLGAYGSSGTVDPRIVITKSRLILAIVIGAVMVPAALWQWGPKLISPPTVQIAEVQPPPPPPVTKPVQKKKVVVQKPAAKKIEQPQQPKMRLFW